MALGMTMRLFFVICCTGFIGACSTVPSAGTPLAEQTGTPASKLSPGECGLFGWSAGDRLDFIFYADEKTARYDGLDGPVDLIAQTPFPATEYKDSSGKSVRLRLGEGETMSGGLRYPGARVVSLTDEGWERLHPVAIVKMCQPAT